MKKDFKKYLMGLLKLKHPHPDPFTGQPSMSEALKCEECGLQVAKAQAIYDRMRKEHPEDFVYKEPEFQASPELEKTYDMLIGSAESATTRACSGWADNTSAMFLFFNPF